LNGSSPAKTSKRTSGGLGEFPHWKIEGKERIRLRLRLRNHIKKEIGMNVEVKEPIGIFQQTFSHFKLTLKVYDCEAIDGKGKGKWVLIKSLYRLPMSRLQRRIAETLRANN
jgi:A/G-specific adenine glycosylase